MTTQEKSKLWTMVLDSVSKTSPLTRDLAEIKSEAGKIFRELLAEIGDGRPDFNGVRQRLP